MSTCVVCLEEREAAEQVFINRRGELVELGNGEMWPCCKPCWEKLGRNSAAVLERLLIFSFDTKQPYNPQW